MNFTSALVEELCSAFGIQKCRTTAYHAQCNGQVERFHQTLFQMIGKLAMDKKAQWEHHLPKLTQAYNSTRSVVTGYSPHYLMFGRWPRLPVDFFFPIIGARIHAIGESLPTLKRCRSASNKHILKPSTNSTTKQTDKREIMINLQAQSN